MTRLYFLVVLAFSVLAFQGAAPAFAQEQMPGFNLPAIISRDDIEDLSIDFNEAFDTIDNAYLSDTIKLNYQISLLEKLVTRQAAVDKIGESYAAMGLPFEAPAPARGICAQLPPNAPCLKYYPDLYSDLVAERKAHYDELEARRRTLNPANPSSAAPEDPEAIARREREEEERKRQEAALERHDRYRWTELSCLFGQCHAVLVKPSENGYRATVRAGSRLADGAIVKGISAGGVNVVIDGDMIHVRPLPGETASVRTGSAASDNPITESLARAGIAPDGTEIGATTPGENRPAITPVRPVAASTAAGSTSNAVVNDSRDAAGAGGNATAPAGQTISEPALGPSGLF